MGTRNLIAVFMDGEYKVAQYCQWDGYPSGQGKDILEFLKTQNLEEFKEKLRLCKFLSDKDVVDFNEKFENKSYKLSDFPEFSRDTGSDILKLILDSQGLKLQNSISFSGDSLFCEYGYVVDFDKETFEFYKGYNKKEETGRFKEYLDEKSSYTPITLVGSWNLKELPEVKDLEDLLESQDD